LFLRENRLLLPDVDYGMAEYRRNKTANIASGVFGRWGWIIIRCPATASNGVALRVDTFLRRQSLA
jgi:hypothetical protein